MTPLLLFLFPLTWVCFLHVQNELQGIATKIGELESESDEHACVSLPSIYALTPRLTLCTNFACSGSRLVLSTLLETLEKDGSRKCFRLVGGVLVERTVKDVVPALQTNNEGVSTLSLFIRWRALSEALS